MTAPGTSPIRPDKQPAFCQDQVAFMQQHGAAIRYDARARGCSGWLDNN